MQFPFNLLKSPYGEATLLHSINELFKIMQNNAFTFSLLIHIIVTEHNMFRSSVFGQYHESTNQKRFKDSNRNSETSKRIPRPVFHIN